MKMVGPMRMHQFCVQNWVSPGMVSAMNGSDIRFESYLLDEGGSKRL